MLVQRTACQYSAISRRIIKADLYGGTNMVAATKIKYYVLEPLNEIKGIGNKAHTRGQIVKKV